MGVVWKIALLAIVAFLGFKIHGIFFYVPEVPILEETWWGPGNPGKEDTSIKPFKINVADDVLKDLQTRLSKSRPFTPPLENTNQDYGMNSNLLKTIVDFWRTKYDWREREKFLNQYPQFTTSVQGLRLHYIHVKPQNPGNRKVLPLLLVHGWPGSVREFYEIIPMLTTPRQDQDFVFEVIVPSLPGYGFSEGAVRPGLGAAQVAVVFKNLMQRLGFEKYYLQGGDWGALIVSTMSSLFPEKILGVHSNFCLVNTPLANLKLALSSIYPSFIVPKEKEHLVYPRTEVFMNLLQESGYMHLQATKPDTVGVGLNDSPAGLAAYIIEKFTTWTNKNWRNLPDGGLTKKFTYTNLLDNVMIYWVTNSITTSIRLYYESFSKAHNALGLDSLLVTVPAACARFPYELMYQPTSILADKYQNLVQVTDYDDGGHFAAFELPKTLADDVYTSVAKMRAVSAATKKKAEL